MIVFPNCKINLGLQIIHKRADGFHNLETIFYPIAIKDAVEIITSFAANTVTYTSSGNTIEGKQQDNLCIKAYNLLKKDFANLPAINLHLHKVIPTGAGLGGGSADAGRGTRAVDGHRSPNRQVCRQTALYRRCGVGDGAAIAYYRAVSTG